MLNIQEKKKPNNTKLIIKALVHDVEPARQIIVKGQVARCLRELVEAKQKGVTALEVSSWALRLGAYVYTLRDEHDLIIRTDREKHVTPDGGQGSHARYVLLTQIQIIEIK